MKNPERLASIRHKYLGLQGDMPPFGDIIFLLEEIAEREVRIIYYETEYQDEAGVSQLATHLAFAKEKIASLEAIGQSARAAALEEAAKIANCDCPIGRETRWCGPRCQRQTYIAIRDIANADNQH